MSTREIIKFDTDICKLSPYIKQVKGFDANSASPTDTWTVTFKDNVYYENTDKTEEPLKRAFIKLFISTDTTSYPETKALEYEIKIYRDIIRPLIDYNICKNFVKYLGSGLNCTYDDLKNILTDHLFDTDDKVIIPEVTEKLLKRNLNCINEGCGKRSSINREDEEDYLWEKNADVALTFKINMIMNEQIPPNTVTLGKYLYSIIVTIQKEKMLHDKLEKLLRKKKDVEEKKDAEIIAEAGAAAAAAVAAIEELKNTIYPILFQLAYTCYSLFLSKVAHNDLHTGNIFVHTHPEKTVMYVVNGNVYKFDTIHTLYIYDFDRSYSEKLGINDLLIKENCRYGAQCNYIISSGNKDFFKAFCHIEKILRNLNENKTVNFSDQYASIMNLFAKNLKNKVTLKKTYDIGRCFFENLYRQTDSPPKNPEEVVYEETFFKDLYSMEEILVNFKDYFKNSENKVIKEDIFIINKDYFNNIGELNINKVQNDRKEFLKKLETSIKPLSVREEALALRAPSIKPLSVREEALALRAPSVKPLSVREEAIIKELPLIKEEPELSSKYFKIPKGLVASKIHTRFLPRSAALKEIILSQIKKYPRRRSKKYRRRSKNSYKKSKRSKEYCKKRRSNKSKRSKEYRRRSNKSKSRKIIKDVIKYINKEIKRSRRRV